MMKNTYTQKASEITRDWHIIDATGLTVGRLSTEVATLLRGKHKPTFTPHMDGGDNVIIINAEHLVFTGNKMKDKKYYRHTGHPGGIRSETAEKLMERAPERVIESAVKGMLPKNILGRQMYRKLFVYAGSEHPHAAQKPTEYTLKG